MFRRWFAVGFLFEREYIRLLLPVVNLDDHSGEELRRITVYIQSGYKTKTSMNFPHVNLIWGIPVSFLQLSELFTLNLRSAIMLYRTHNLNDGKAVQ
jgi:hypothetical protein